MTERSISSAGGVPYLSMHAAPIHPIWVGPIESIGALSIISRCSALLSIGGPTHAYARVRALNDHRNSHACRSLLGCERLGAPHGCWRHGTFKSYRMRPVRLFQEHSSDQ